MPTVVEHLQEMLRRHAAENDWGNRKFAAIDGAVDMFMTLGRIREHVIQSPASQGYEPWLVQKGWPVLVARMMAWLLVRHGTRKANDLRREPKVRGALKELANPNIKKLAKDRRIRDLLLAWEQSCIVEAIFDEVGLDVFEFIRLLELERADSGQHIRRLAELASLAISKRAKRGPKISAESAAHNFLLENLLPHVRGPEYSWSGTENSCTDPASEATAKEFGLTRFDARSAVRMHRRRR